MQEVRYFMIMQRIIQEINPKIFIFENVTGLLNHDKGKKNMGYY